jgi:hypothetical protein
MARPSTCSDVLETSSGIPRHAYRGQFREGGVRVQAGHLVRVTGFREGAFARQDQAVPPDGLEINERRTARV